MKPDWTDRKEYDRLVEALNKARTDVGLTNMGPAETIEALVKAIIILRGEKIRLQARGRDPSGRWG